MKRFAWTIGALLATSIALVRFGAAAEPTGNDYLKFFKTSVGRWVAKTKADNKDLEVIYTVELGPTQQCLVSRTIVNGQAVNDGIQGYDPASKSWKSNEYSERGVHTVGEAKFAPETFKGSPVGKSFVMEMKATLLDGKKYTANQKITIAAEDRFVSEMTAQILDGKPLPDRKLVFQRQK